MHEQLPITLLLCVRAAPLLLLGRLAAAAVRAMLCTCFPLPPPEARLETALLGGVLGPSFSGVFPGPHLLAWLQARFWRQDQSVAGYLRGLQVCPNGKFLGVLWGRVNRLQIRDEVGRRGSDNVLPVM